MHAVFFGVTDPKRYAYAAAGEVLAADAQLLRAKGKTPENHRGRLASEGPSGRAD
jgi:hypothetical protein